VNILAYNQRCCDRFLSKRSCFFEEFNMGRILKACSVYKVRGFSFKVIFQVTFERCIQL